MNEILIGNLCGLGAMVSDSVSGTRKKNSEMLAIQIISQFFYGAGSFILKGYSSTVQNLVSVFRNIAAMKGVRHRSVEWGLILTGVILGAALNNRGLIGWLPIIANLEYSAAVFRFTGNERGLKLAFLANNVMFAVFNLVICNFIGAITNAVVMGTTAASLMGRRTRKHA